jgi:hypothetical protein
MYPATTELCFAFWHGCRSSAVKTVCKAHHEAMKMYCRWMLHRQERGAMQKSCLLLEVSMLLDFMLLLFSNFDSDTAV